MEEIRKYTGKRIREARKEKAITQRELGKFMGYSPMGVSHFENGIREIKLTDLHKLAGFLKKDLAYFLPEETALFRTDIDVSKPEVKESLDKFNAFLEKQLNGSEH